MLNWFESGLGISIVQSELECCGKLIPSEYYARGLQVGFPGYNFLRTASVTKQYLVQTPNCPDFIAQRNGDICLVQSVSSALPFPERSQNLVVLPHALDFCGNPHEVLRQVNQILEPEGCLAIIGFNASSLYGVIKGFSRKQALPWSGSFYSVRRVQDWLSLLGYDLVGASMMAYQLPIQSEKWRKKMAFLESAGDRWWPGFGGVYIIVGRKKEQLIRPLFTSSRPWQRLIPGMARPASASQKAAKMGIRLVKN